MSETRPEIILPAPIETPVITAETAFNRRNTEAFIAADPVELVLTPYERQVTPGGGVKYVEGPERAPQVFRMLPQSDVQSSVQNPDGIQLNTVFVLMGPHDALMERWDTFTFQGDRFQIVSPIRPEHTNQPYFRKADVGRF